MNRLHGVLFLLFTSLFGPTSVSGLCDCENAYLYAAMGAATAGGTVVALPAAIAAAGFGPAGVAAGSVAAKLMSLAATTGYGGTAVAALQSWGATGATFAGLKAGFASAGAAAGCLYSCLGKDYKQTEQIAESSPSKVLSLTAKSVTSNSVTVEWRAPLIQGSGVIGFVVQAHTGQTCAEAVVLKCEDCKDTDNIRQHISDCDQFDTGASYSKNDVIVGIGKTFSQKISSLDPSTDYNVKVFAINARGKGAESSINVKPVPSRVLGLTPTALSSDHVTVEWRAPMEQGTGVVGFGVKVYSGSICSQAFLLKCNNCQRLNENNLQQMFDCDQMNSGKSFAKDDVNTKIGKTFSQKISSLDPSKDYNVKVFAINARGKGVESSINVKPVPSRVVDLTAAAITSNHVTVEWRAPTEQGSGVVGFGVMVYSGSTCSQTFLLKCSNCQRMNENNMQQPSGCPRWGHGATFTVTNVIAGSGFRFSQAISSLGPATDYSVVVFAINARGKGMESYIYFKTERDSRTKVGVTVAIVAIVISVIVLYLQKRKKEPNDIGTHPEQIAKKTDDAELLNEEKDGLPTLKHTTSNTLI